MKRHIPPPPELADHAETMKMLRARAGGDQKALAEAEEWGRRRERRLPVLRRFAALLRKSGVIGAGMDRINRDFAIAQCYAIATGHGLDMMDYEYNDCESGPLASLMDIDLHAVEIDGTASPDGLFPDSASERAFLDAIAGKDLDELGRMAREAVIPEHERVVLS